MIRIRIHPDQYTISGGQITGWASTSPFKNTDWTKFAFIIGKSADVVYKSNYATGDETFGGTKALVVNHIGAEIYPSMLHTMVNNTNQYDYVLQMVNMMERGIVQVLNDGTPMTVAEVLNFSI